MNLTINLYKYTGDHRRVVKELGSVIGTIAVHTSEDTSLINPDLIVDYESTRIDFNYGIIPELNNRHYFVTPELSTGHKMILHCFFDPYTSYDLTNIEGIVTRNTNASGKQNDESVPLAPNKQISLYTFPKSPYKWSSFTTENNNKENYYVLRTR